MSNAPTNVSDYEATKTTTRGGVRPMSNAPTNVSDYDAITKTIQPYIDGARSGRGADMKPAFHKEATIFGYAGTDLFAGPIQKLFEWNDRRRGSKHGSPASTSSARSPPCGWNSTTGPTTGTPTCSRCSKSTGSGRS